MNEPIVSGAIWQKSSYSSGNGQCVEIAFQHGVVATRDSKDIRRSTIAVDANAWAAFIHGLQAGSFSSAM
ncbi:DUF397 domain-containing protein [Streptomyces morookaense]|uniref:DUF397 domain-containing protein n=1 Tax=Streptomyces morookaense TaxID=1970 RepID=UPI0033C7693D